MKSYELIALRRVGWSEDVLTQLVDAHATGLSDDKSLLSCRLDDRDLVLHRQLTTLPWLEAWCDVSIGASISMYTDGSGVRTDLAVGCAAAIDWGKERAMLEDTGKRAARLFEAGELTEAQLWRILEDEEDALIAVTRKREATK